MKAIKLKALAFIAILLAVPLFSLIIQPAYGAFLTPGTVQIKEHRFTALPAANDPTVTVTQSNVTGTIEMNNGPTAPPIAEMIIMIVFEASRLNGQTINFTAEWEWAGAGPLGATFQARIYDGSYLRSNATQFPDQGAILTEGNGLLQTGFTSAVDSTGFDEESFSVSINATFDYATLMFVMIDAHDTNVGIWTIQSINITDPGGIELYSNDFECSLDMEVLGTDNDYGFCGANPGDPALGALEASIEAASLIDPEACGKYVFAEEKFYNFSLTIGGGNISDTVMIQVNDTVTNVTLLWDNVAGLSRLVSGREVAALGTVTTSLNTITNFLTVNFPIFFKSTILDTLDVNILAWANDTTGFQTSWVNIAPSEFNIYSEGGLVQTVSSGTAGRVAGGDTFELQASNLTSSFANQTFRKIQQFRAQFGLRLSDGAGDTGFVIGFQDLAHNGGVELYMDKGDWQVEIAMNYCDEDADVMVKGFYVIFEMEEGDLGVNDLWTVINATWYDADDIKIRSGLFTAWPETQLAQIRFWIDLWYNKINASSIGGGRLNAYYTGMDTTAFLLWQGGWAPFITNSSDSMGFIPLKNDASEFITSPQLDLMSISVNISRPANSIGTEGRNITATLLGWQQSDNKFAFDKMIGIDTPTPVETKVPDMPVTGFFAPLIAAVLSIGGNMINAFIEFGLAGWRLILAQFPGLEGFINNTTALLTSSILLATTLIGFVVGLFSWMANFIQFMGIPVNAVIDMVIVFTDLVNTLIPEGSRVGIITILVLLQLMALVDDLSKGDTGKVWNFGRNVWNMTETIINIAVQMANFAIRVINAVNPF